MVTAADTMTTKRALPDVRERTLELCARYLEVLQVRDDLGDL